MIWIVSKVFESKNFEYQKLLIAFVWSDVNLPVLLITKHNLALLMLNFGLTLISLYGLTLKFVVNHAEICFIILGLAPTLSQIWFLSRNLLPFIDMTKNDEINNQQHTQSLIFILPCVFVCSSIGSGILTSLVNS